MSTPIGAGAITNVGRAIRIPIASHRVTEALPPSYVELHTRSQWKPGYQGLKRVPYLTDKAVREKRRRHTFAAEFDGRR